MTTATTSSSAEERAALRELADDLFTSITGPHLNDQTTALTSTESQWTSLHESGLTLLTTPEECGGNGAGPADAAIVAERAGYHALPRALGDNDLLGAWLLYSTGLDVPTGSMVVALTDSDLSGTVEVDSVPFVESSDWLLVVGPGGLAQIATSAISATPTPDLGGEQRARVSFDAAAATVTSLPTDMRPEVRLRGALVRSWQISGAVQRCLDLAIDHVQTREQFGRPLARFQAVGQLIARSAGAVAMARTAADQATSAVAENGFGAPSTVMAIAAAKIQAGKAATQVARQTHQAHGAIGFTLDHQLRHFSGRAQAWGRDFGTARAWQRELGSMVLANPAPLWEQISSPSA
ncbi:acyl-CoA dehydrogenase [Gordonia sp. VNQ95]|uniref:acyl-CoA dehydrogenase n=1 Tax=Gordonia sp. VNQ95 TaxID=3156619 RepID=UPI0032B4A4F1